MNKRKPSSDRADHLQHERNETRPDNQKPFNPFEGRDKEEVWKEISKNGTSMSQPEVIRHLRDVAAEKKRQNKAS